MIAHRCHHSPRENKPEHTDRNIDDAGTRTPLQGPISRTKVNGSSLGPLTIHTSAMPLSPQQTMVYPNRLGTSDLNVLQLNTNSLSVPGRVQQLEFCLRLSRVQLAALQETMHCAGDDEPDVADYHWYGSSLTPAQLAVGPSQ